MNTRSFGGWEANNVGLKGGGSLFFSRNVRFEVESRSGDFVWFLGLDHVKDEGLQVSERIERYVFVKLEG
jgi:hypothetical protein